MGLAGRGQIHKGLAQVLEYHLFFFFFFFFFPFWPRLWHPEIPEPGIKSNQCHSNNQSHGRDKAGPLPHGATRELLRHYLADDKQLGSG